METLHPELWTAIFSDQLYIIEEVLALEQTIQQKAPVSVTKAAEVSMKAAPVHESMPVVPASPSLAAIKEKAAPAEIKQAIVAAPLKPTGAFSNGVLVLIHESQSMSTAQQEMLTKIAKAVQLELPECGILQLAAPVSLKKLEELKPRFLLCFGIPMDAFNPELTKKYYEIQKYNSMIILLSDALSNLEKTDTLKRNLWNALKEMFGMK